MEFGTFALVLTLLFILWILLHYYAKPTVYISDKKKKHSWKKQKTDIDNHILFCNICENLIQSGFVCEYCSVACDKHECTQTADRELKCKQQRERSNLKINEIKHLYVKGNLFDPNCFACKLEIKDIHEVGIHGVKCAWCHYSFHESCLKTTELFCDFGKLKNFIIPPFSVKACRTRKAPTLHLKEITPIPEWKDWEPLIVICNQSSGGQEADQIAILFRRLLNPIQVILLSSKGPAEALEIVKCCPVKCRILVCGGDGSVSWTLNVINEMNLDDNVKVAICPQGTGNDLARVLNWGAEIESEDLCSPFRLLDKIRNAETVKLDRWKIEFKYDHRTVIRRLHHDKEKFMYNYFSIGVDALVTLNFHKTRESAFYIIKSKIINKFLYFIYGSHQVISQDCEGLNENLAVYLDGVQQELPKLQSLVTLNIGSWGSGVYLINMLGDSDKNFIESHSICDKQVEVFGISSSFHIAQLQVGLNKPFKFGRASQLKIKLKKIAPVQIDGEPSIEAPCEILLSPHSQATMLKCQMK